MQYQTSTQPQKKLLDQVRDAIRVKHYSIRTEQAYTGWIRRYILFHDKRHPQEMDAPEITAFLTYLAVDQNVAALTKEKVKIIIAALSGVNELVARLLYGSGLRLIEGLRLRVKDLDFSFGI